MCVLFVSSLFSLFFLFSLRSSDHSLPFPLRAHRHGSAAGARLQHWAQSTNASRTRTRTRRRSSSSSSRRRTRPAAAAPSHGMFRSAPHAHTGGGGGLRRGEEERCDVGALCAVLVARVRVAADGRPASATRLPLFFLCSPCSSLCAQAASPHRPTRMRSTSRTSSCSRSTCTRTHTADRQGSGSATAAAGERDERTGSGACIRHLPPLRCTRRRSRALGATWTDSSEKKNVQGRAAQQTSGLRRIGEGGGNVDAVAWVRSAASIHGLFFLRRAPFRTVPSQPRCADPSLMSSLCCGCVCVAGGGQGRIRKSASQRAALAVHVAAAGHWCGCWPA